jgi:hypothetical protein
MNQFNSTDEAGHPQGMLRGGSSFKSLVFSALNLTCFLYVISVMIAASYYNWQYTREHSFADWLVFGEIAPTAKAFVWPYFAAQRTKPQEIDRVVSALSQRQINEMQIMSAMRAVAAALQANYIINSRPQDSALTQEQVQKVIDYATQSLRSADTTDEEALNRLYPEFGTRFKRDFCGGQRLLISGLTSNSRGDLVKSSDVDRAWKDWYNPNRKQIEDAFNAALQ